MTLEERSNLVLVFPRVPYVNGQSRDQTLAAAVTSRQGDEGSDNHRRSERFGRHDHHLSLPILLWFCLCVFAFPAHSQTAQVEPLPGPDSHEAGPGPRSHLLGEWGGVRTNMEN